jgi:hypothetical protein
MMMAARQAGDPMQLALNRYIQLPVRQAALLELLVCSW